MQPLKPHKIDLKVDYPCPCGRRGKIVPISMTEAFGCDRCHHIFTVDEKHCQIQQLSTLYAGKKAWHWTGSQWKPAQSGLHVRIFTGLLWIVFGLLLIAGLYLSKFVPVQILWVAGIVGLILLFFLRFVLYRH